MCLQNGDAYHCCAFLGHSVVRINCCDPQQVLKPECLQPTAQGKPQCYRLGCCSGYREDPNNPLICVKGGAPQYTGEQGSGGSELDGGGSSGITPTPTPGEAEAGLAIETGEEEVTGMSARGEGRGTGAISMELALWILVFLLALAALLGMYYLFRPRRRHH